MKKFICILLGCIVAGFIPGIAKANAYGTDRYIADPDQCLVTVVGELLDSEIAERLKFERQTIYDAELHANGYAYFFELEGENGYALMIRNHVNGNTYYEVPEVSFEQSSPFKGVQGLPIYIKIGLYLEYADGQFTDIVSGENVSESLSEIPDIGFGFGNYGDEGVQKTETISFARREQVVDYKFPLPQYNNADVTYRNSCVNVAGANVLGYYDRFQENLIPNFVPGRAIGSMYLYTSQNATITQLIDKLCALTNTNVVQDGTTVTGFKTGFRQYVTGQGYQCTYNSLMNGSSFNFAAYQSKVDAEIPVIIFSQTYNLISPLNMIVNGNTEEIIYQAFSSNHAMIGCGYKVVNYYDGNNNRFRQNTYLRVSSGDIQFKTCFVNLGRYINVTDAFAITIS